MGETLPLFTTSFNKSVHIESRPDHLTGDAGVLVQREIMERTGIIDWLAQRLHDPRNPDLITYPLAELLRTHLLLLGQGWRDQDDADRLRQDPGLRVANSAFRGIAPLDEDHVLASQPTLSRLVSLLSTDSNRTLLRQAIAELASRRLRLLNQGHRKQTLTLDVDSLPVEVHGHQFGSEWNGHYHRRMYHPLVASCAQTGDLLDALLRPGRVHTADGALGFILDLVDHCKATLCRSAIVRIDAGFPDDETLSGLESRQVPYVARIRNNKALDRLAEPYLKRPPGRPPQAPREWCHEARYQAGTWNRPRRVVLVVLERPGELFLDHFWLITSLDEKRYPGERLLALYRKRGKAEAHMGELMDVLNPALSSATRAKIHCRGMAAEPPASTETGVRPNNETLFLLNLLAYEVLHVGRTLMEKATHQGWSLRRFRERVLRVASRVICHGRRLTFVIAQSAAHDWQRLWRKLNRLQWAPG
jgi:hypothetical protein